MTEQPRSCGTCKYLNVQTNVKCIGCKVQLEDRVVLYNWEKKEMTEEKELNLLEYIGREDELQLRDGRKVLKIFEASKEKILAVYEANTDKACSGYRYFNGKHLNFAEQDSDIILKPKAKKKYIRALYKHSNLDLLTWTDYFPSIEILTNKWDIIESQIIKTEEIEV